MGSSPSLDEVHRLLLRPCMGEVPALPQTKKEKKERKVAHFTENLLR